MPAWRNSLTLWEEARRGAPTSYYVLNALGWSYRQANRLDDAERVLVQADAIAPGFPETKLNLAAIAFLRNDLSAAERYTEHVLQLNPRDTGALRFRGVLFEVQGRRDLAIESLKAAVASNPSDALSRRCLADLETAQGSAL